MTAPFSSQAGLASFSSRPRPMLADEHAQGLHGDDCGCTATNQSGTRAE